MVLGGGDEGIGRVMNCNCTRIPLRVTTLIIGDIHGVRENDG